MGDREAVYQFSGQDDQIDTLFSRRIKSLNVLLWAELVISWQSLQVPFDPEIQPG